MMFNWRSLLLSIAIPPTAVAVLFFFSYFFYLPGAALNDVLLLVYLEHLEIAEILGFDMAGSGTWISIPGNLTAFCLAVFVDYVFVVFVLFLILTYFSSRLNRSASR